MSRNQHSLPARWLVCLALALGALTALPSSAQAENLIRQPGAHRHYSFELEPKLNLFWRNYNSYYLDQAWVPFGPGIRFTIPFMHNGPISTLNNNMAITFGADTYFPYHGFGLQIPVAAQWNFYFTDIISVLGEAGLTTGFTTWDTGAGTSYGLFTIDPYIQGGGRFQFGPVGVLVRVGYPTWSVGANFQF
jgi:hypothetical protein